MSPALSPAHRSRSRRRVVHRLALAGAVTMVGSAAAAMEVASEPTAPASVRTEVASGSADVAAGSAAHGFEVQTRTIELTADDAVELTLDGMALPDRLDAALASDAPLPGPQPAPELAPVAFLPVPAPVSAPDVAPDVDADVVPDIDPEPAPASDGSTPSAREEVWDRLAECESGQDWEINTGNGYFGGLQFDHASWHWAGGDRYSEYPHRATRVQQIEIAERLLAIHPAGWGAWPACSARLGLG